MVQNDKVIEVVYGTSEECCLVTVKISQQATVESAIVASGLLEKFPAIDLSIQPVGIFSKKVSLTTIPHHGDRIEIYRPLVMDPKERRRYVKRNSALEKTTIFGRS